MYVQTHTHTNTQGILRSSRAEPPRPVSVSTKFNVSADELVRGSYSSANERCVNAKESNVSSKEPEVSAQVPCIS